MPIKDFAFIRTDNSLTVHYGQETYTVLKSTEEYEAVLTAIREGRRDDVPDIISKAAAIKNYSDGRFEVVGGCLKIDGTAVPVALADKILEFQKEKLPYDGLICFAKNLLQNPSFRAVQQLFTFLEKNSHPITDDGCFIAYRAVRPDFKDKYTGTIDNTPGLPPVSMPRNEVNEDPNVTCSNGLHVANWDYAHYTYGSPGDPILEVKVNPRDVVAVPTDYNRAKMRCCEYLVLGVVENARKELFVDQRASVPPSANSHSEIEDEDDDKDDEENDETEHEHCSDPSCNADETLDEDHHHMCVLYSIESEYSEFCDLADSYDSDVAVRAITTKYTALVAAACKKYFEETDNDHLTFF